MAQNTQVLDLDRCDGGGKEKKGREGRGAYHPVRHGDGLGDGEPERAEADEAERGADEQHEPGREAVAEHAGDDAEVLADVVATPSMASCRWS